MYTVQSFNMYVLLNKKPRGHPHLKKINILLSYDYVTIDIVIEITLFVVLDNSDINVWNGDLITAEVINGISYDGISYDDNVISCNYCT